MSENETGSASMEGNESYGYDDESNGSWCFLRLCAQVAAKDRKRSLDVLAGMWTFLQAMAA